MNVFGYAADTWITVACYLRHRGVIRSWFMRAVLARPLDLHLHEYSNTPDESIPGNYTFRVLRVAGWAISQQQLSQGRGRREVAPTAASAVRATSWMMMVARADASRQPRSKTRRALDQTRRADLETGCGATPTQLSRPPASTARDVRACNNTPVGVSDPLADTC